MNDKEMLHLGAIAKGASSENFDRSLEDIGSDIVECVEDMGYQIIETLASPLTPKQPELGVWDGEGFPPVGMHCDKLWDSVICVYYEVKVLAIDGNNVVFRWLNGPAKGGLSESWVGIEAKGNPVFRPIRTPEQISAEERQEWICEAKEACTELSENQIGKIYDALISGEVEVPRGVDS